MAREVKCPVCDKLNPREEVVDNKIRNRYYCDDCYEKTMIEEERKQNSKQDYNDLYDYIEFLYKRKPDGQIFKQIKRYKDNYDYTYIGMRLTLKYFHEVLENPVNPENGIGIIAYFYRKARNYYNYIWEAEDYNSEVIFNDNVKEIIPKDSNTLIKHKRKKFEDNEKLDID